MSEPREKEHKPVWSTENLTRANEIIITIRVDGETKGSLTLFSDEEELLEEFKRAIEEINHG